MRDSTSVEFSDSLLDYSPSIATGYAPQDGEDTSDSLMDCLGSAGREFPDHLLIPESDWKDWARENDQRKLWPEDWRNRFTNQSPTHECTCHALLQNGEIAWNRQRKSKENAVWFSALSVYSEANPRQWGGSTMQRTVGIAIDRGYLPDSDGPGGRDSQKNLFKHTLHCTAGRGDSGTSSGSWVRVSNFPSGWKQTARHFRPLEVINPRTFDQVVSLILHGCCVSVGRSGHAIPYVQIVWRDGSMYAKYSDSYNVHRYDSVRMIRSAVGGAYGIWSMTTPDDWDKPAGEDMA